MAHSFESYFDRPMDGNDRTDGFGLFWARFFSGLFAFLCRILFRYRVENQDVVRAFAGKRTGAMLVAPHVSYLDVVVMYLSVRPVRFARLIARDSLFEVAGGALGWVIARVGAFPIKRNAADRLAIKRATRMLKNGEFVGIFPEGTRRGKGSQVPELHGGAALIARMGKAPIIPLGLVNLDKVKRKGERVRFPRITAVFGQPVEVSAFDFLPKEQRLDGCAWFVMRESFALSRGCAPEDVDMAALFPDSFDFTAAFDGVEIPRLDPATLPDYRPKED